MEVILLETVRNLGNLGDQVNVKPGFGRNFLLPFGKAVVANKDNVARFEAQRAELEAKAEQALSAAKERAEKLQDQTVTIAALASDEGKLYGSISPADIATGLTDAGFNTAKREVIMPEGPIHQIGEYEVQIQLHSEVTADVKVQVVAAQQ